MIDLFMQYQDKIMVAMGETELLMLISISFAIILGLPLGTIIYVTRKNGISENKLVSAISNLYVNIVRSFPFILFVFFMMPFTRALLGISLGTIPASVPMVFVAVAIFARFVEQALLEVPTGIIDTAISMGASKYQLITKFLYVEARSGIIHGLTSSTISLLSYSTVMGMVGGGGIGAFAMLYGYQNFQYDLMMIVIVIIVILVQIIQFIGTKSATYLDKR
ncbi:MAG: ABC transporter permease subunit [Erysipelothrix sp.]|nr:ABC transporter permease subunit [Erysipelothrix sp.]